MLLVGAHGHRYKRSHVALRGLSAPRQQRAKAACNGGKNDVIDGAAERAANALDIRQL
jgi:hypothetical protein